LQQGLHDGYLEGIEFALDVKFGGQGLALLPEIKAIPDVDRLRAIFHGLKKAKTLEEARQLWS